MKRAPVLIISMLFMCCASLLGEERRESNIRAVAETDGLVAFWDFSHAKDSTWTSYCDPEVSARSYPLHLKRIGDPRTYSTGSWPYEDTDSRLMFDDSGPFGKAVRFNKGYIYGAVEREHFDKTPLDLHGRRPFTMITWVKFIGKRHMVAGIWDEGGWNRYAGRRQVALFAGLFGKKGVIAHVSDTGAASYPQSTISGAQYARCRAIDGKPFENNQWIAMATTFDPERAEVVAYLNGTMTPYALTDPVTQDVYQYKDKLAANPFSFPHSIYSPRAFVLKYNGYNSKENGISEHRLHVDLDTGHLTYERDERTGNSAQTYRLFFDVKRQGKSLLGNPIEMKGVHGQRAVIPPETRVMTNDEVSTTLEIQQDGRWKQVGTVVKSAILEGAPFTFGRALGLGSENLNDGSQLYLDGVAVFNRVLKPEELKALSFNTSNND